MMTICVRRGRCLCCWFLLSMFPSFGEKYYVDLVMKIMILSVFALSLELLVGQTGLVSFGHAAFFGIGAYVAALLVAAIGTGFVLASVSGSAGCSGPVRTGGRRAVAAHTRHLLHHGHARFCADGVLRVSRHQGRRW